MKPPNFIECSVCGREFGSRSILIHERQCLQKLRRTEIPGEFTEFSPGGSIQPSSKSKRTKKKFKNSTISPPIRCPSSMSDQPQLLSQKVLLPRIETAHDTTANTGQIKSRISSKRTIRPTTATLAKPKFLNPELMKHHDMSLTRIDYDISQLKLNDDENHNDLRQGLCLFPEVQKNPRTTTVTKLSPPSTKFDSSQNQRRSLKLPDSVKNNSLMGIGDLKRFNTDTDYSFLPLPNNSSSPVYSLDSTPCVLCPSTGSSYNLPVLHLIPYSTLSNTTEQSTLFPKLPNHRRVTGKSDSDYILLTTTNHHTKQIYRTKKKSNMETKKSTVSRRTSKDELEFFNEHASNTILPTKQIQSISMTNKDSNGRGHFIDNDEPFVTDDEESSEASDTISPQPRIPDSKFSHKESQITQTQNEESEHEVEPRVSFDALETKTYYPNPSTSSQAENKNNLYKDGTNCLLTEIFGPPRDCVVYSSGSDCDNEGTSSGYGFLRPGSNRVLMLPTKNQKGNTSPINLPPTIKINSPLPSSLLSATCTEIINDELNSLESGGDKKRRSRMSRGTTQQKVTDWLTACTWATHEGSETIASMSPPVLDDDSVGTSEHTVDSHGNSGKIIFGLVSATFKVKEKNELRTYKFMNKVQTGRNASTATSTTKTSFARKVLRPKTTSPNLKPYYPSKAMMTDERVLGFIKKHDILLTKQKKSHSAKGHGGTRRPKYLTKRPKTSIEKFREIPWPLMSPSQNSSKMPVDVTNTQLQRRLEFGPRFPTNENPTNYSKLKIKKRPLTPRPKLSEVPVFPTRKKQNVLEKISIGFQIPEKRSMATQSSPVLSHKTIGKRPEHVRVKGNEEKQKSHKRRVTFSGDILTHGKSFLSLAPSRTHQSASPSFPQSKHGARIQQSHVTYQFQLDRSQDLPIYVESSPTLHYDLPIVHSTYTLMLPKNFDSAKMLDLNVVIRRKTSSEVIDFPSIASNESSMYLFIDEVTNPVLKEAKPKVIEDLVRFGGSSKVTEQPSTRTHLCERCEKHQAMNNYSQPLTFKSAMSTDSVTQTDMENFEDELKDQFAVKKQKAFRVNVSPSFFPWL